MNKLFVTIFILLVGYGLSQRKSLMRDKYPQGNKHMPWAVQDAETVRQMIKHETDVIHHRLTWLVTLHGFLFAALGFAWKDGKPILPLLAILGIATSLSLLIPLSSADTAIRRLVDEWDKNKPPNYTGPDVIGFRPVGRGARWLFPWFLLPSILALAWIVVAYLALRL